MVIADNFRLQQVPLDTLIGANSNVQPPLRPMIVSRLYTQLSRCFRLIEGAIRVDAELRPAVQTLAVPCLSPTLAMHLWEPLISSWLCHERLKTGESGV